MSVNPESEMTRRAVGENVWLAASSERAAEIFARREVPPYKYEVFESEDAVGAMMLGELEQLAAEKSGDITLLLLGGRGAQAMYRRIRARAENGELDGLLARLHVFTQDALRKPYFRGGRSRMPLREPHFDSWSGGDFGRAQSRPINR